MNSKNGMTVGFVQVFVSDFATSLRFYTEKLGFEVDYTDGAHWAQFHSGPEVALAIVLCNPDREEAGGRLVGRFVGVTLMVEDIEAQYARLARAGVTFTGAPKKQSFGGVMAHFADPDGNVLTIRQEAG